MRDKYLDFLRFVGIMMIILAHTGSSNLIHQIRCFDVPLMLFVSGLAYGGKVIENYKKFIIKRTKRLIIPCYLFLVVYFTIALLLDNLDLISSDISFSSVIGTFLFLDAPSIGYFWIIRVQLLVMLVIPMICFLSRSLKIQVGGGTLKFVLVGIISVVVLLLDDSFNLTILKQLSSGSLAIYILIFNTIPYVLAYSVPFFIGSVMKESSQRMNVCISVLFALSFVIVYGYTFINKSEWPQLTPDFKYPPRMLFIIYGISVSSILWVLKPLIKKISDSKLISFIGQNTMWIYLWHIPMIDITIGISPLFLRYIIVTILTLVAFLLQYKAAGVLNQKSPHLVKYLIG